MSARIVAAARALVGVRFRLHGRSAARGLDCVGLAALVLGRAAPEGYSLRSGNRAQAERWLREAGLVRVEAPMGGDLVLVRPGPLQLHVMIRVPGGHVHAHAGLGRVVEMPGEAAWPVLGHWRAV